MATSVSLSADPILRFCDNNGNPLVGGMLTTTVGGILFQTYSEPTGTYSLPNPIILNSRGEVATNVGTSCPLYLVPNTTYTFLLQDSLGNTIGTYPGIYGVPNAASLTALVTSIVTASYIGNLLYPITPAETLANIIPANQNYPEGIVNRYGTNTTPGITDMTPAFAQAIAVAIKGSGYVGMLDQVYGVTGLTINLQGNRSNQGLLFQGVAPNVSVIQQIGTPTIPMLSVNGTGAAGNPTEIQFLGENFTIMQATNAQTADGITLTNVANWRFSNVISRGFGKAFSALSSLIGTLNNGCQFTDSNYGIFIDADGSGGSTCNLISIENCKANLNKTWGIWYGNGTQLHCRSVDIEGNGTSANINTGGVRIRPNLAPDSLVAGVLFDHCWLESNLGVGYLIDHPAAGVNSSIEIRGGNLLAQENGMSIVCNGATTVRIEDLICATPGDTWSFLSTGELILSNCLVTTLNDSGVTTPYYNNVQTSAAFVAQGRLDTALVTLTGTTAVSQATARILQQGDQVEVDFPDLIGTSNLNTATITGLPVKYSPSTAAIFVPAVIEDNANDSMSYLVLQIGGTMTLYKNGSPIGFTSSGSKGLRVQQLRWRIN